MTELERLNIALGEAFKRVGIYKKGDMANYLGYRVPYFSGIINGKEKISDKFLNEISDSLPISKEWILTGKGEMLKTDSTPIMAIPKENQELTAVATPSDAGIPLIPLDAVAGFCSGNSAQILEYECERYVVPTFRGAEFMIPVKGSSMYPKYSSGDIVACKCLSLDTFFQWNKVYVVDTEQGVLIKRVSPGKDDDHIRLISENEKYLPFEIHRSQINSLALVIGVIRLE